ncbi:hypothetical protein cyc_03129 [Cyclospora cayetanensis]|uniref:Protein kinase domain-containing protein n=1 Tax=Cyclospora cayetanensis TaxID=88456 RepID=A0A1D3CYW7_9EIME|nr:hypothetical protein cyc_03129 [Cyclospora cayetanensis]
MVLPLFVLFASDRTTGRTNGAVKLQLGRAVLQQKMVSLYAWHDHRRQRRGCMERQQPCIFPRCLRVNLKTCAAAVLGITCCLLCTIGFPAAALVAHRGLSKSSFAGVDTRGAQRVRSFLRFRAVSPHASQLFLQLPLEEGHNEEFPFESSQGVVLLQKSTSATGDGHASATVFSSLLRRLPGRLHVAAQQPPSASEGLSLSMAMSLCRLSFDDLDPKLGGGTYGEVYPMRAGALSGGPCIPTAAQAEGAKGAAQTDDPGPKFAVKVFRLRGLVGLMKAAEEGQKELRAPELQALKKAASELKSVNLKDPFTVSALKEVLEDPGMLGTLEALQQQSLLSPEAFLQNFAAIRSAIYTKCFLDELEETGLIFIQMDRALEKLDPAMWEKMKDASKEERVSLFATVGRRYVHWSLPLGRVLVKDKHQRLHWGVLVNLFDGDLEPQANRNSDGSILDGWAVGERNAVLKEIFAEKSSLLSLSSKAIQPFVYMHNFFGKESHPTVQLAAGDFGMATLLGQNVLMRGTVAFMAPEIERPKKQTTPPPRIVALPEHDVFALGLTLAYFWSVSAFCPVSYPWVERCIVPHIQNGATFSFDTMSSTVSPQLYTPIVKKELKKCLQPGGRVDKLYSSKMPFVIKLKIAQMTEVNPNLRISMNNAFSFMAVTMALETVRGTSVEDGTRLLEETKQTSLFQLSLKMSRLEKIDTQGQERQQQATRVLRALQDLAIGSTLKEVVEAAVSPVALEDLLSLDVLPAVTDEEKATVRNELEKALQWAPVRHQEGQTTGATHADRVDAVFGLSLDGLEVRIEQEITDRKMEAASVAVSKAVQVYVNEEYSLEPNTQLLDETPSEAAISTILRSVGVNPERESEVTNLLICFFSVRSLAPQYGTAFGSGGCQCVLFHSKGHPLTRDAYPVQLSTPFHILGLSTNGHGIPIFAVRLPRACASYVSWTSADRLVRVALRRCVSSVSSASAIHRKYASGNAVTEEEATALQDCMWAEVKAATAETHYGLPWGVSGAKMDFGFSESQVSRIVRDKMIKVISKTAWSVENAKKLLLLQIKRAVYRLPSDSLPGGTNLRGVYAAVLREMHKDHFVPLPFGVWDEREEYIEALYDIKLSFFRELVAYTATKEELSKKAAEILHALDPEERAKFSVATLRGKIPESMRAPERFGLTEQIGEGVLEGVLTEALYNARKPEVEGLTTLSVSVNGAFLRSPKTNRQIGRPAVKHLKLPPEATAGYVNEHFTNILATSLCPPVWVLLRSIRSSLAPGCSRYKAILKRKMASGKYEALENTEILQGGEGQKDRLRLYAVPPATGTNARTPNNCFLWTAEILRPESYTVLPAAPSP